MNVWPSGLRFSLRFPLRLLFVVMFCAFSHSIVILHLRFQISVLSISSIRPTKRPAMYVAILVEILQRVLHFCVSALGVSPWYSNIHFGFRVRVQIHSFISDSCDSSDRGLHCFPRVVYSGVHPGVRKRELASGMDSSFL